MTSTLKGRLETLRKKIERMRTLGDSLLQADGISATLACARCGVSVKPDAIHECKRREEEDDEKPR